MRFRLSRTTKMSLIIFAVLGMLGSAGIVVPMLMVMSTTAATSTDTSTDADGSVACGPALSGGGQTIQLDSDQLTNARTIVRTGQQLGVPGRGLVIAIATALQESKLRNLDYGDRDSLGLFQQRGGWGSAAIRTDPAEAAAMFYTGGKAGQPGLLDISGWLAMPLTQAAQQVQRSAYPLAYADWEPIATSIVQSVAGDAALQCASDSLTANLPAGAVGTMLRTALAQQGDPYVWGAVGPDAFDCSGLVVYSWQQAGYRLSVRTAAQMYANSDPVPAGQEQPGDLLFGEFTGAGPGHVMIVVTKGTAVQAPETGRDVEVTDYSGYGSSWRLARLRSSVLTQIKG